MRHFVNGQGMPVMKLCSRKSDHTIAPMTLQNAVFQWVLIFCLPQSWTKLSKCCSRWWKARGEKPDLRRSCKRKLNPFNTSNHESAWTFTTYFCDWHPYGSMEGMKMDYKQKSRIFELCDHQLDSLTVLLISAARPTRQGEFTYKTKWDACVTSTH